MDNIKTVLRYREALHLNVEKIAKHYNEDVKQWLNYITNFVEKNNGILVPIEQYRLMYNKSVELLNEL